MSLEKLNEELHGRNVHLDRSQAHRSFDPASAPAAPEELSKIRTTEHWDTVSSPDLILVGQKKKRRRYIIAAILGAVAISALALGIAWKLRSMAFSEERVELTLSGPASVASAEPVTFAVAYANQNWTAVKGAALVISFPESFHPDAAPGVVINGQTAKVQVGDLPRNASGKQLLSGKFYGSKGELGYMRATLSYTPAGVSSAFEKNSQLGVNVASSPLSLEAAAPAELVTGQEIDYVISYTNQSDQAFDGLRVQAEYPDGFQFISADLKPASGNNLWNLPKLGAGMSGKIVVHGTLSGTRDQYKRVHAAIGTLSGDGSFTAYTEAERQTRIIASPLSIIQKVNGSTDASADPGQSLSFSLAYKNDGDIGLRDVVITEEIDTAYLDTSRLSLKQGAYDENRKMIVWKSSDIPELARLEPGAGGEIGFSIPIRKEINVQPNAKSNPIITATARIDSPDVPAIIGSNKIIPSNVLVIKLNSLVAFGVTAFHEDPVSPNSGPTPPVAGQETTYTVRVSAENSSNDVSDAKVNLILPTGVSYKGKFSPADAALVFNERSNRFDWNIGTLGAGEKREIFLQVGVTPNASQVGATLVLVQSGTFMGHDTFVDRDIRIETKGAVNGGDGQVRNQ